MSQEQDPAPVGILAQREALTAVTRAVEVAVADDLHVAGGLHRWDGVGSACLDSGSQSESQSAQRCCPHFRSSFI
jgi:hypothetical protein